MKKGYRVGYVNPNSIDLDLAYMMSNGWAFSFDEPQEHLTTGSVASYRCWSAKS